MSYLNINPILRADSYKYSHAGQYPPGTTYVSSYTEARGVEDGRDWKEMVVFGIQPYLKFLEDNPITREDVDNARGILTAHGVPFDYDRWMYIVDKHDGKLPLNITALPEGTVIPIGMPFVQIVNTDPECAWLTNFIETQLLRATWYPVTVATQSFHMKRAIRENMLETCDTLDKLPFMLHDFGARGVTSSEQAQIGGCAHLTSFQGTDTVEALLYAHQYYSESMSGFSIPATEHSTMTSWTRKNEVDAFRHVIALYAKKDALISVVSDSYDIFNVVDNILPNDLKDELDYLRDIGATLVIRPDSGDPETVPIQVIEKLMNKFGYYTNSKGYKVLPDYLRVIQGDGIDEATVKTILNTMKMRGLSADNIAFGSGGALLQKLNRDTLKMATKANDACVNGEWRDVYKDPFHGGKGSKRGRQIVLRSGGSFINKRLDEASDLEKENDLLSSVFYNGQATRHESFALIRSRIDSEL